MPAEKIRLDIALVERGLASSRARAQAAIKAGHVFVAGQQKTKPSDVVFSRDEIDVRGSEHSYVSRAALKLLHALGVFSLDVSGHVCLDLGASTGGFTQVLLERGAGQVIALDVGHGQLADEIRIDARVRVIEGMNVKDITQVEVPEPFDVITADLSFISLEKALPAALSLAPSNSTLVALIKPQFEVGRKNIGKGGIVRDAVLHEETCTRISQWLGSDMGWHVMGITESPIEGGDGNREFLLAARRNHE